MKITTFTHAGKATRFYNIKTGEILILGTPGQEPAAAHHMGITPTILGLIRDRMLIRYNDWVLVDERKLPDNPTQEDYEAWKGIASPFKDVHVIFVDKPQVDISLPLKEESESND